MSKVLHKIMMRKTKATLVDMLEEQRQFIIEANVERDNALTKVENRDKLILQHKEHHEQLEGKYDQLKVKHSSLHIELGRRDNELSKLKNAYIDKLELAVDLYERIL